MSWLFLPTNFRSYDEIAQLFLEKNPPSPYPTDKRELMLIKNSLVLLFKREIQIYYK